MKKLLGAVVLLLALANPILAVSSVNSIDVVTPVHYLDNITWLVTTKAHISTIYVECTTNASTIVNTNVQSPLWSAYDNYNDGRFKIGESISPYWIGGGANCTASLYEIAAKHGVYGVYTLLDTVSFEVLP